MEELGYANNPFAVPTVSDRITLNSDYNYRRKGVFIRKDARGIIVGISEENCALIQFDNIADIPIAHDGTGFSNFAYGGPGTQKSCKWFSPSTFNLHIDLECKGECPPSRSSSSRIRLGMRVRALTDHGNGIQEDFQGTLVATEQNLLLIEYDEYVNGHEGRSMMGGRTSQGRAAERGHGWCYGQSDIGNLIEIISSNFGGMNPF